MITSTASPLIKQWRQLKNPSGRRAHGLFLAEGEHLCAEAVKAGRVRTLLLDRDRLDRFAAWQGRGAQVIAVSAQVIAVLADSKTPQGCIAVCPLPAAPAGGCSRRTSRPRRPRAGPADRFFGPLPWRRAAPRRFPGG